MIPKEIELLFNKIGKFLERVAEENGFALNKWPKGKYCWELQKGKVVLIISIFREQDLGTKLTRSLCLEAFIRQDGKDKRSFIRTNNDTVAYSTAVFFEKTRGKGKRWSLSSFSRTSFEQTVLNTVKVINNAGQW